MPNLWTETNHKTINKNKLKLFCKATCESVTLPTYLDKSMLQLLFNIRFNSYNLKHNVK